MQREPEIIKHEEDSRVLIASRYRLLVFIADHTTSLYGTIRSYVARLGAVTGGDIGSSALEVMQEMVVEALSHANNFDSTRQPMAWLLGIALNVLRRRRSEEARRYQREVSLDSLSLLHSELENECDLLDSLHQTVESGPEQLVESDEQARALLSLVPEKDQEILRLAILEDFDRSSLAKRLGTSSGAARMRLHRALDHLRLAWKEQQEKRGEGENDE
ncbi:MAG TPA: sigma-70 family RNA polymerase sigma factor [Ktedonobacteraceae bacterium]